MQELMADIRELREAWKRRPAALAGLALVMTALAMPELLEIISALKPLARHAAFPYFHELSALLAMLVAIVAAHLLSPAVGRAALALFFVLHAPYFAATWGDEFLDLARFLAMALITVYAVGIIAQRRALSTRLEALYKASTLVTSSIDADEVIRRVITAAHDVIGYSHVTVLTLEEDQLVPSAWSGSRGVPPTIPLNQGVTGRVARTGVPAFVPDVSIDPDFIAVRPDTQSEIAYPILIDDAVVGVLNVESTGGRLLRREDFELLGNLALQLGVALRHARQHRHVQDRAMRDGLTGLINHVTFKERLQEELARANRQGRSVALLMADLDDFKVINDRHGHPAGDRMLRLFAGLVRAAVRGEDIPARYGGEEFAVIMPDTTLQGALMAAERIRSRVEQDARLVVEGHALHTTVSLGVAVCPDHASDGDALIRAADEALYVAKRFGKNAVRVAGGHGHVEQSVTSA